MKRNIAFLLPDLHAGGAEKFIIELANYLSQEHDVTLYVLKDEGPYQEHIKPTVNKVGYQFSRCLKAIPCLFKDLKRNNHDIIITTMIHMNSTICLYKLLFAPNQKIIVRESTSIEFYKKNQNKLKFLLAKFLIKFLYPIANKIVTPSARMNDDLRSAIGNLAKISTIHNHVDTELINEKKEQDCQLPGKGRFKVITVGRIDENKNQLLAIKAFEELNNRDIDYILVGDGDKCNYLKKYVANHGLEDNIFFLGYQANPYKFMNKANLFVLTSNNEGFPNILLQAMACGNVIASTDCETGPREILGNNEYGILFPVNNQKRLKKIIQKTYQDFIQKKFLSKPNVEKRLQKYQIESIAIEYLI